MLSYNLLTTQAHAQKNSCQVTLIKIDVSYKFSNFKNLSNLFIKKKEKNKNKKKEKNIFFISKFNKTSLILKNLFDQPF